MFLRGTTASAPHTQPTPHGRRVGMRRRHCPAMAFDLGSARTRVWTQGHATVLDVPTATPRGTATVCPVHRGAIVDPAGLTMLISRLLADRLPAGAHPVVVFTTPVLSDARHHTAAVGALQILRPRCVLAIDSVKAIALDSGADLCEPLLVLDIGAHLSEVALLTDGSVTAACRGTMGTSDLATSSPAELVTAVTTMITKMLCDHPEPQLFDALDRGPLLAGGGALHPELTHQLAARLHSPVQPVPGPHNAAIRGAAHAARLRPAPPRTVHIRLRPTHLTPTHSPHDG